MSIEAAEFRRVLGHFASGVAVVSSSDAGGGLYGLTANAISSVSLEPPLVLVCVDRAADTHAAIERSQAFAISVLGEDGERLARRFADEPTDRKFSGIAYRGEATGAPVLDDAVAWLDCRVWATYEGGDHTIFVGLVAAADAVEGPPLLYFRGGYGRLTP